MLKYLTTIMCLCLCAGAGYAADWYVGTTANLTNAVAQAASNDTVFISNGTYQVNLIVGEYVKVRSVSGLPADVILDGNATGRVVTLVNSSWLVGCTVSNGGGVTDGGGIIYGSISNCIVTKNTSTGDGGGGSVCIFYNSVINGNTANNGGGGAGVAFYNSTIYGNTSVNNNGGGGLACSFYNSISWGNNTEFDSGCSDSYSCGAGFTGTGSITNDPLFISSTDFRLQSNSPCINIGTNGAWTVGATDLDGLQRIWPQGGIVDIGAYEYGSQTNYPPPVVLTLSGTSITHIKAASISAVKGREK
jgi:hypothetical protein